MRDEVLQGVVEAVVVAARGGAEGDLAAVVLRDGVEWATQGRGAGRAAVLEELLAHVARDGRHAKSDNQALRVNVRASAVFEQRTRRGDHCARARSAAASPAGEDARRSKCDN